MIITAIKKYMTKIIFFDTDCICCFLWTQSENLLKLCFNKNMIIPKQVYDEICFVPYLKQRIDMMINDGFVLIEDIPNEILSINLYLNLTQLSSTLPLIGRGEAAAIVLTKRHKGILASNNLKDVKRYVKMYNLEHITTADIIHRCVKDQFITQRKANIIWKQMISKRRKLPFNTYFEYLTSLKK